MSGLGDLTKDLIGTDPKYPKIVNQGWLDPLPAGYDNYPSDNNPVRVIPKLSEMWNHEGDIGVSIIPNATVQSLGARNAEQKEKESSEVAKNIVREAKKAMMSGLRGKEISDHLKSRFQAKSIEAAAEGLKKLAEEQGLIGNVYIDASAFSSYEEAAQFLNQNKKRLAQDILFDAETMNPNIVARLASDFRKNVVSSITYDEKLLSKYKSHLVMSGRISQDAIIDSKESLRMAFLHEEKSVPVMAKMASVKTQKLPQEKVSEEMRKMIDEKAISDREASDAVLLKTISPVISFAQESLSKGKDISDLKEMLRSKFAMNDIESASAGLRIMASEKGLTAEHVDELETSGEISSVLAEELKKIAKKFPIKKMAFPDQEKLDRPAGVQGFWYSTKGSTISDEWASYREAATEALRKGIDPSKIKDKLLTKLSSDVASKVLSDAVAMMNSTAVGSEANKPQKPKAAWAAPELPAKKVLPTTEETNAQVKEFTNIFAGADTTIEVNDAQKYEGIEIGGLFNMDGIDSVISS